MEVTSNATKSRINLPSKFRPKERASAKSAKHFAIKRIDWDVLDLIAEWDDLTTRLRAIDFQACFEFRHSSCVLK
jgi:hypothetical protein